MTTTSLASTDAVRAAFEQLVRHVFAAARTQFEAEGFFVAAAPTGMRQESIGTDILDAANSLLLRDPTTDLWLEFTIRLRTQFSAGASTHEVLIWVQAMGQEAESLTQAWGPDHPDGPFTTAQFLSSQAWLADDLLAAMPSVLEHCNQHCAL